MNIISFINHKGGVGKTTSVANIGYCLAERGKRVLMIDFDPQANLTSHFGLHSDTSLYDVFREERAALPVEQIRENLDIVPSNLDLALAELDLGARSFREYALHETLERCVRDAPADQRYDLVLIDCPPTIGIFTLNAMTAADSAIIVAQTQKFSIESFPALFRLRDDVTKRANVKFRFSAVLATMYDHREIVQRNILETLRADYGSLVASTVIRSGVACRESVLYGQPVVQYQPESNPAKDYRAVTEELIDKEIVHG